MQLKLHSILSVVLLLTSQAVGPVFAEPGSRFRRGDSNDDGRHDLADSIRILNWLFAGSAQIPCSKSADVNDDGRTDMSDPISFLGFLFLGAAPPPPPFPACGNDPTPDDILCDSAEGSCPGGGPEVVGAAGGTVPGPNGSSVVIPPGALATDTTITIEQTSAGAPALPAGFSAFGLMFAFTPHGTTFAVPVTMTLPFDPAAVPAGAAPAFYKTNAQNQWEQIANPTFSADSVSAEVTSFSSAQVIIPSLDSSYPLRVWSFSEYRGDGLEEVELDTGVQTGGFMHKVYDFGPAFYDAGLVFADGSTVPPDGIASGNIFSSEDGNAFWVSAEAPLGNAALPNDPIGSTSRLMQVQTFIKRADDATLKFTMNNAFIMANDLNAALGRICPPAHADPNGPSCDLIKGELFFALQATNFESPRSETFFYVSGSAKLEGFAGNWDSRAWNRAYSHTPLWAIEDFDFTIEEIDGISEGRVSMTLRNPHTYTVDLSSIEVGKGFNLWATTEAITYNRAAKSVSGVGSELETSVGAYFLMDPLSIGGTSLEYTGLEPISTPLPLEMPDQAPVPPAACVPGPGPNPAAGVLQFSAASYSLLESSSTPAITVTRTGGSSGAVTATFTTSDGTAIGGRDYTPVNTTVFFADGDAAPRVVDVPIVQDLIDEPDVTVNLTLSQPGGCAALGTQTTAVLTIRNDDITPPTRFTVGGTVTGLVGKGLVLEDHHGLLLEILEDGPFTFSSLPTPSGMPYFVGVFNRPHDPAQVCTVTNGTGTFTNANITNVLVTCASP